MRIIIDTEMQTIIVPNKYYDNIDQMNKVAARTGGKPLEYIQYVKDEFEKAIGNPMKRLDDVKERKPRDKSKEDKKGA